VKVEVKILVDNKPLTTEQIDYIAAVIKALQTLISTYNK